jgi:hypothetical protein
MVRHWTTYYPAGQGHCATERDPLTLFLPQATAAGFVQRQPR